MRIQFIDNYVMFKKIYILLKHLYTPNGNARNKRRNSFSIIGTSDFKYHVLIYWNLVNVLQEPQIDNDFLLVILRRKNRY